MGQAGDPQGAREVTDTLLLLDGNSLAYRAFFALPTSIVTSTGQITNAVYGFTSMLLKLLGEQKTDRVGVAFDIGAPTVRLAEYSEYKANRSETPGEFKGQMDLVKEVLDVMNVPQFGVPGHEADDINATLAKRAQEEGFDVILVTADRDYLQLVRPGVRVLFNRKGVSDYTLYDEAAVEDRFGLPPTKLLDYAALRGDPSDNLPGVPGVGEKTAAQLIQQFGSIEELFEHLDDLPKRAQKLRPALEEHKEQILLNKRLARLVDDLEIDIEPRDIQMGDWDEPELRRLFTALQFKTLLERITDLRPLLKPAQPAPAVTVRAVTEPLFGDGGGRVALAWTEDSDGIAVAEGGEEATWVSEPGALRAMLEDPKTPKVAHDAKTLAVRLARAGIKPDGFAFDTQIAAYLLDPAPGKYELGDLSTRYLNRDLPLVTQGDGDGQMTLGVEETSAAEVASAYAAALLPLADRLESDLDRLGMTELFRTVEMPLVDVLVDLELTGVAIDADLLRAQSAELGKRVAELEQEIYVLGGGPFNLNSPPQLRTILYDKLGLKPTRRTKTGFSTDAATLESLRGQHDIVEALLEYRELSKLQATYLDPLPRLVDPKTGRVHATFKQTAVATGRRLACGRLFSDRAACARPHHRGSGFARSVRERRGRPRRDGGQGVGLRRRRRSTRPARARESDQLRPGVRDEPFRPRAAARHHARRGAGVHRRLLPELPDGQGVHGRRRQAGVQRRLHEHPRRAAPLHPRARALEPARARARRTPSVERADTRIGGRHLQAGDGEGSSRAPRREFKRPDGPNCPR
ncbi:MAG: hypothetical protein E6G04_01870 [Actinobacteria bacterium]|nr:MAG: hypothetical protein E6G04_01870 [Actinomycetota bacterium]